MPDNIRPFSISADTARRIVTDPDTARDKPALARHAWFALKSMRGQPVRQASLNMLAAQTLARAFAEIELTHSGRRSALSHRLRREMPGGMTPDSAA